MKSMKKLAFVLLAAMLVVTMAWAVAAENEPTITVDTVSKELATLKAEDTFDVNISLANNPGITAMTLKVTYDEKLEIVSINDSKFIAPNTDTSDLTKNPFTVSWMDATAQENITTSGTVFTFKFKVKDVSAVSTGLLAVDVAYDNTNSEIVDKDFNNVDFDVVNGGIDLTLSNMTGVNVSSKRNLVYTGVAQNSEDLIDITGAPEGYTATYEPATVAGAYYDDITVKINAPGYAEYTQSVLVNVAKAEAVISGLVARNKDYDGTKDVVLEVTDDTTIEGLLGTDAAIAEFVTGYTFTGLFADANKGDNKPVVAVKNAAEVLGDAAANYNLVIANGITANVTKTTIVPTAIDYSNFNSVKITTATDEIEVNLNKSASAGIKTDNGATHALQFKVSFVDPADAEAYNDVVTIDVPAGDVVTFKLNVADTNLGTLDFMPAKPLNNTDTVIEGYFIKGMRLLVKATATKPGYRANRIEIDGKTVNIGAFFALSTDPAAPTEYTVKGVFTKKTAVYPAPGTDKDIIEQTKSDKIVLTIGSTEATVFGTQKINDVAPIIINDRTMLPARFVAEALGAKVEWDNAARKVSIFKDMKKIEIYIGKAEAYINGQAVALDSPAIIQNDRTYMPVRFIAETLGANVKWNEATRQVVITK